MNLFRKPPSPPSASPQMTDTLFRATVPSEMASVPGNGQDSTKADEMVRLMAERHKPRRRL